MWKVENKKETSYLKFLAKAQSIEMITAPPNHQAFPQEHWDHCCQWSKWPNCSSSSLPPTLQIQSLIFTFISVSDHLLQLFLSQFPLDYTVLLCYFSAHIMLLSQFSSAPSAWKLSSQACQRRKQTIKAGRQVSYFISHPLNQVQSPSYILSYVAAFLWCFILTLCSCSQRTKQILVKHPVFLPSADPLRSLFPHS